MMENPLPLNFKMFKLLNQGASSLENTKILIVGVGGIGCQILKVLCKMPIGSVHIIDMDTIQLSNLNRQFLFKKEHKGMSKSLVAKQTILKINPHFNIVAHHKNIKELPINFFRHFDFLIMALDNIQARNYVNKIGVRLSIPIIDAGTLGYKGNVATIIPKQTKCYACEPKSAQQKVFPVCTIRMRPEKPIHCIVWAKLLFEVLFGPQNDDNDLKDLAQLAKKNDVNDIMAKLFESDILQIKNAKEDSDNKLSQIFAKSIITIERDLLQSNIGSNSLSSFSKHQEKLSVETNISIFAQSFQRLVQQKNKDSVITFQKDDDNIIHFISSAANLRMHCFSIEKQSFNEIKNMAGNIIPAIASTNSIVSGIQIVEMMKLVKKEMNKMKFYFVQNLNNKVIGLKTQSNLQSCQICHPSSIPVIISTNLSKYTLQSLVSLINEKSPTLEQFSINYGSKQFYNSDDPKQTLLEKSILDLCSAYEADLVVTNQNTMKKVCTVWLIHDDEISETQIKNQQQLLNNISGDQNEDQQIQEQKKQVKPAEEDDSDIVMFGDQQSPDIQIIQIKKVEPSKNDQDQKQQCKQQLIELQKQVQNGKNQVQAESSESPEEVKQCEAGIKNPVQNGHSDQAQKREAQPLSLEQQSQQTIKKKVKQNEGEQELIQIE